MNHKTKGFTDAGIIGFESEDCKKTSTEHNCDSLTIEINNTLLDFGNDA